MTCFKEANNVVNNHHCSQNVRKYMFMQQALDLSTCTVIVD